MIKFNQLRIKHFRQLLDVVFDFDYETGIYVITGANGTGKSTFLNAINWCLYGDTPFNSTVKYIEVANNEDNEGAETYVELFVTIDDLEYRFYRRTQKGQSPIGALTVQCLNPENGDWETLTAASGNDAVRRFVPKEIRQLFFFNGEQLKDNYSGANTDGGTLKDNIYKISEIEIIDNGIKHLTRLEKSYMSTIAKKMKNAQEIEDIKADIEQYESAIKGCDELIAQYKGEIDEATAKINALNDIIADTADARKLLEDEKRLKDDIDEANAKIDAINLSVNELLVENFGSVVLFDHFTDYAKKLSEAREKDLIPAPVSPKVTQHILQTGVCICHRDLDDESRKFIEEQDADYSKRQELQFLTDGIYEYSGMVRLLPEVRYNYLDKMDELEELRTKKEKRAKELTKVTQALATVNTANLPQNPVFARDTYEAQKTKKIILLTNAGNKKEEAIQNLKAANIKLQSAISQDSSVTDYEKKRVKTGMLIGQLETLRKNMEKSIRTMLEENIWEVFSDIFPETKFSGVEISDTYSINLRTKREKLYSAGMLSTGQAKALGLSLVYALSKDLGYSDVPLMIDNLYGDISKDRHDEVSKMIASLSDKKQIVIMNLPEIEIHQSMVDHVKAKYVLELENGNEFKSVFRKES